MGAGEVLIKAGAELMARNNVGIMPLHAASLGGHAAMGRLLLENGRFSRVPMSTPDPIMLVT